MCHIKSEKYKRTWATFEIFLSKENSNFVLKFIHKMTCILLCSCVTNWYRRDINRSWEFDFGYKSEVLLLALWITWIVIVLYPFKGVHLHAVSFIAADFYHRIPQYFIRNLITKQGLESKNSLLVMAVRYCLTLNAFVKFFLQGQKPS